MTTVVHRGDRAGQHCRMYEITIAEYPLFAIRALDFRGTPAGIDVTLVARTGILPQINTGMAGKVASTSQVAAGLVTPPADVRRPWPNSLQEPAQASRSSAARASSWTELKYRA